VDIFKYILVLSSMLLAQNGEIKFHSINKDTILNNLNEYLADNSSLTKQFILKSFQLDNKSSIYDVIDTKKKIDSLIFLDKKQIHDIVLNQIFSPFKKTILGSGIMNASANVKSRYYFINKEPNLELGLLSNEILCALLSFEPNFESHFSGVVGINRYQNKWNFNGEINLKLENYFMHAEHLDIYWRRLDSLSQVFKINTEVPHPLGWDTGINFNYHYEIFNGLYTFYESRIAVNSYNQILKNIGIGYVLGRTNATQKGFSYGFYNVEYKAFSLSLKNNFINDRLFPNSGFSFHTILDIGLDENLYYLEWNLLLNKYYSFTKKTHYEFQFISRGIDYYKNVVPKSRYFLFGGSSSLRGYDEKEFSSPHYQILTFELGYRPNDTFQTTLFFDLGSDRLNLLKNNWIGYGFGLKQIRKDTIIKLEYGLSDFNLNNGKIHFEWISLL
tara:strand:+ start:1587 stop:2918 length:1332 start_codon:yes stop_codon:yes gene_type:complete